MKIDLIKILKTFNKYFTFILLFSILSGIITYILINNPDKKYKYTVPIDNITIDTQYQNAIKTTANELNSFKYYKKNTKKLQSFLNLSDTIVSNVDSIFLNNYENGNMEIFLLKENISHTAAISQYIENKINTHKSINLSVKSQIKMKNEKITFIDSALTELQKIKSEYYELPKDKISGIYPANTYSLIYNFKSEKLNLINEIEQLEDLKVISFNTSDYAISSQIIKNSSSMKFIAIVVLLSLVFFTLVFVVVESFREKKK